MFQNHNWDIVLGSTYGKNPTLRLSEDTRGLIADADLPDNEWGRPIRDAVDRGDISSMSFGFTVPAKGDTWSGDKTERQLTEVKLYEVSPVTAWPAYPATSASVRTLADFVEMPDEELDEAIRALSPEHYDTLMRALNAHLPTPVIDPFAADFRAKLAGRPEWLQV